MEAASCFCVIAAAVCAFALLWRLKEGGCAGSWTLAGALAAGALAAGASLCVLLPPGVCGVTLLGCSFILKHTASRRAELLPPEKRSVLVTGCDSGFGHSLAKRLSEMGLMVFAGVLHADGPGAQQLRRRAAENLQVLQLDVTDDSQIEAALLYVRTRVSAAGLWGLVNNAGVLQCPMDAELQPITSYRACLDVNYLGAVKMCQAFLPLLRRSRGRIVNVSSMAGEVPLPTFGAYAASKAALSVFTQVLRQEISQWGVKVILIEPSAFRTNIFGTDDDIARYRGSILTAVSSAAREDYGDEYILSFANTLSKSSRNGASDLSPVVDDISDALLLAHPKPLYRPGRLAWLFPFLHSCLPTAVFDFIIMKQLKYLRGCKPAGLSRS